MNPISIVLYPWQLFVGALVFVISLVAWRWLHCWYKKGERCCPKCGHKTKRIHKIRLASDESVSIKNPSGFRRWWIRRVVKFTISKCTNTAECGDEKECGLIRLVKVSAEPISIWHAWWTRFFHPDQFKDDPALETILSLGLMSIARDPSIQFLKGKDNPPPSSDLLSRFLSVAATVILDSVDFSGHEVTVGVDRGKENGDR